MQSLNSLNISTKKLAFFNQDKSPMLLLDKEELIIFNPAMVHILDLASNTYHDNVGNLRYLDAFGETIRESALFNYLQMAHNEEIRLGIIIKKQTFWFKLNNILHPVKGDEEVIISFVKDVTKESEQKKQYHEQNKKLFELVKESNEKLLDSMSLSRFISWQLNLLDDTILLTGNLSDYSDYGIDVDRDVIKLTEFFKLVHPDEREKMKIGLDVLLTVEEEQTQYYSDIKLLTADGQIRYAAISVKYLNNPLTGKSKLYGTFQDITQIRKDKEQRRRLSDILEITSDMVIIFDKEFNLIYLNRASREFYGFDEYDNIQGFPIQVLQTDESALLIAEEAIPTANEKGVWTGENTLKRFDMVNVDVSQNIIAHKNSFNNVEYYSSIIRDISKQKRVEKDLIYKNRELDTFVYKASHDLRGPITSMLGMHQVVVNEVNDPLSLSYFEIFNKQLTRLNEVIITLIELTRVKETKIKAVPIDFEEIINSCIETFSNLPNSENITFKLDNQLTHIFYTDKGLITTILQNLIENSIKYSKPNTISNVLVKLSYTLDDNIMITVQDQGIGMSLETQNKVFDMFFRASSKGIGSGLGLYILKSAVDKLKGHIKLQSEVDKGSTFKILIPKNSNSYI